MCGILGHFGGVHAIAALEAATQLLHHRGPEALGTYHQNEIFLAHTRLRIIDNGPGSDQPLVTACGQFLLVFNGEIYNYNELSAHLGLPVFASDSHFLLHLLQHTGFAHLNQLRGMYAFAFYNKQAAQVHLVRDPSGIKPLYYTEKGHLSFASELPPLVALERPSVDARLAAFFKATCFVPEPHTWYKHLLALRPGTRLTYSLSTHQRATSTFFQYQFEPQRNVFNADFLRTAVNRNRVADVPIFFALSGGIDSSLLLALADKNTQAITVGFKQRGYDERDEAAGFAQFLGVNHTIVEADGRGTLQDLLNNLSAFGQPFVDVSTIPFGLLSKAAAEKGKVLVGGDGADEIFGGYAVFRRLQQIMALRPFLKWSRNAKLQSLYQARTKKEALLRWITWDAAIWQNNPQAVMEALELLEHIPEGTTWAGAAQAFYHQVKLQSHYLRKTDIMSMQHSLEYRVPFLDEDLVQHAYSLPMRQKTNGQQGKLPLRQLHSQLYQGLHSNRPKTGFRLPLETWLGPDGMGELKSYLMDHQKATTYTENQLNNFFEQLTQKHPSISRDGVYHRLFMATALTLYPSAH